jgi:hypothetical protein
MELRDYATSWRWPKNSMSVRRLHVCICLGQKHLYSFAVLLRESRQNVAGICSSAPWRRRHRSHAVPSIYASTAMGLDEKGQDYRGIVVTMIHKFRDMPAAPLRCQLGNLAKAAATFLLAVSGFGIPSWVS